jgi:hypothetical protein
VLGYLLAGVAIGPTGFGLVTDIGWAAFFGIGWRGGSIFGHRCPCGAIGLTTITAV